MSSIVWNLNGGKCFAKFILKQNDKITIKMIFKKSSKDSDVKTQFFNYALCAKECFGKVFKIWLINKDSTIMA